MTVEIVTCTGLTVDGNWGFNGVELSARQMPVGYSGWQECFKWDRSAEYRLIDAKAKPQALRNGVGRWVVVRDGTDNTDD